MKKINQKFWWSFMKSIFLLCVLLSISLLTACGSSDKTLPTIDSIELLPASVIISASDDISVTGYTLTSTTDKPNKDDDVWTTSTEFALETFGTYYAYAKDEAGNVSEGYLVDVTSKTTLERLAKEYDHLAWIIEPDTTETKALKEQYGDLYRFVEPLTEKQIKERWDYLVNYLVNQANTSQNGYAYSGGLMEDTLGQDFYTASLDYEQNYMNRLFNSTDKSLTKFARFYVSGNTRLFPITPKSFTSYETQYGLGLDIVDKVPLEDMEWFVRDYTAQIEYTTIKANDLGVDLHFYFDPLFKN